MKPTGRSGNDVLYFPLQSMIEWRDAHDRYDSFHDMVAAQTYYNAEDLDRPQCDKGLYSRAWNGAHIQLMVLFRLKGPRFLFPFSQENRPSILYLCFGL